MVGILRLIAMIDNELEEFKKQLIRLQDGLYEIHVGFTNLERLYKEIKGRENGSK